MKDEKNDGGQCQNPQNDTSDRGGRAVYVVHNAHYKLN